MPRPDPSSSGLSLRRMLALIRKEFLQLLRDRPTLAMVVMIPIIQVVLFGYAINTDPRHLPTALVVRDMSDISRSLVAGFHNSEYFQIVADVKSDAQAREMLQKGQLYFVITIEENFNRRLVRGEKPSLLIEADATDTAAIAGALAAVDGIMARLSSKEFIGPLAYLQRELSPINVMVQRLYNPEGFTRYNIIPGLIGVVLTLTGVMMTALALTRELERGTMENLLAMPVRPLEVMFGKILPYTLISYVQSALIILVAQTLFGIPILGSMSLFFLVLLVFIVCNLALGFCISALAKNQTQALQMSFMIVLPSILLTGFLFPFYGMPQWAQMIGSLFPMTYFVRIARAIVLKGAEFPEIWHNVWPMLLLMLGLTVLAIKFYRKTMD